MVTNQTNKLSGLLNMFSRSHLLSFPFSGFQLIWLEWSQVCFTVILIFTKFTQEVKQEIKVHHSYRLRRLFCDFLRCVCHSRCCLTVFAELSE